MAQTFGPAEILGNNGYEFSAPGIAPPAAGCAMVAGSGSGTQYSLGWSLRPVLMEPAVGPLNSNQYFAADKTWKSIPPIDSGSVVGALGYTPVNKAGDTMSGPLVVANAGLPYVEINHVTANKFRLRANSAGEFSISNDTLGTVPLKIDVNGSVIVREVFLNSGNLRVSDGNNGLEMCSQSFVGWGDSQYGTGRNVQLKRVGNGELGVYQADGTTHGDLRARNAYFPNGMVTLSNGYGVQWGSFDNISSHAGHLKLFTNGEVQLWNQAGSVAADLKAGNLYGSSLTAGEIYVGSTGNIARLSTPGVAGNGILNVMRADTTLGTVRASQLHNPNGQLTLKADAGGILASFQYGASEPFRVNYNALQVARNIPLRWIDVDNYAAGGSRVSLLPSTTAANTLRVLGSDDSTLGTIQAGYVDFGGAALNFTGSAISSPSYALNGKGLNSWAGFPIGIAASYGVADVTLNRNATGPTWEARAAGGFAVKNADGSADAPATASRFVANEIWWGQYLNYYGFGATYQNEGLTFSETPAHGNARIRLTGNGIFVQGISGGIGFTPGGSSMYSTWDAKLTRYSTGTPTMQVQADGGLRVQNLAGNADAPIRASTLTLSGNNQTAIISFDGNKFDVGHHVNAAFGVWVRGQYGACGMDASVGATNLDLYAQGTVRGRFNSSGLTVTGNLSFDNDRTITMPNSSQSFANNVISSASINIRPGTSSNDTFIARNVNGTNAVVIGVSAVAGVLRSEAADFRIVTSDNVLNIGPVDTSGETTQTIRSARRANNINSVGHLIVRASDSTQSSIRNGGDLTLRGGDSLSTVTNTGGRVLVHGGTSATSSAGNVLLAHTGSAAQGRVLVGTATDDGANLLQVAGDIAQGGGGNHHMGFGRALSWSSGGTGFNNSCSIIGTTGNLMLVSAIGGISMGTNVAVNGTITSTLSQGTIQTLNNGWGPGVRLTEPVSGKQLNIEVFDWGNAQLRSTGALLFMSAGPIDFYAGGSTNNLRLNQSGDVWQLNDNNLGNGILGTAARAVTASGQCSARDYHA